MERPYQTTDLWTYRESGTIGVETPAELDLTGYGVEAVDGSIGKVDEATYEASSSYLVVDTGPWIFGKKVLIPAGVVDRVDDIEQVVYVDRARDDVKNAPEFDEDRYRDEAYRAEVGDYYGRGV